MSEVLASRSEIRMRLELKLWSKRAPCSFFLYFLPSRLRCRVETCVVGGIFHSEVRNGCVITSVSVVTRCFEQFTSMFSAWSLFFFFFGLSHDISPGQNDNGPQLQRLNLVLCGSRL